MEVYIATLIMMSSLEGENEATPVCEEQISSTLSLRDLKHTSYFVELLSDAPKSSSGSWQHPTLP
jgi:hypothetical protein